MAITDFDSVFWVDPWMRKRTPHARYLFSYLFTNSHKNRACIYPLDLDIARFETGMDIGKIKSALKELEPKVLYDYDAEIVFVINHVRHQFAKNGKISSTIAASIVKDINKLPKGHVFIDKFLDVYSNFFIKRDTLVIPYLYSEGKGREGEDLKYNEAFEKFWKVYPKRNGKKVGKGITYERFLTFPESIWNELIECSKNYSISSNARSNYAKDPERFLKKDYWREWKEPEEYVEPEDKSKEVANLKRDLGIAENSLQMALEAQQFSPSPENDKRVQGKQREVNKIKNKLGE